MNRLTTTPASAITATTSKTGRTPACSTPRRVTAWLATPRPEEHYPGQCSSCHATSDWETVAFNHTGLTDCTACHTAPSGHWPGECANCHGTTDWLDYTFDHTGYATCNACHARPASHPRSGQCSKCHTTNSWEIIVTPTPVAVVNTATPGASPTPTEKVKPGKSATPTPNQTPEQSTTPVPPTDTPRPTNGYPAAQRHTRAQRHARAERHARAAPGGAAGYPPGGWHPDDSSYIRPGNASPGSSAAGDPAALLVRWSAAHRGSEPASQAMRLPWTTPRSSPA